MYVIDSPFSKLKPLPRSRHTSRIFSSLHNSKKNDPWKFDTKFMPCFSAKKENWKLETDAINIRDRFHLVSLSVFLWLLFHRHRINTSWMTATRERLCVVEAIKKNVETSPRKWQQKFNWYSAGWRMELNFVIKLVCYKDFNFTFRMKIENFILFFFSFWYQQILIWFNCRFYRPNSARLNHLVLWWWAISIPKKPLLIQLWHSINFSSHMKYLWENDVKK